ncbi:tyrosine-type recombinase/integrase [Halomonas sp. M5N1S17]|uniref:tyrosine-type recombinase/integrase n=1 Tax=Halomonas alkalisoli TaxID=2907158 RepID=UPI001F1CFBD8|nr:site-specific integrase [Halomonas alkalisoli]MCE9665953.1 tyrosine-type recombinase/integrase [Halomonas alkalisoli]
MAERKPITTPAEVASFSLPEGRNKARRPVKSKHGAGLALEVRAGRDSKLWIYRFNIAGRQFETMLGTFPPMTLKQAREKHGQSVALVRDGIDPRKHRAAEVARNQAAWTMQEAFGHWLEFYAASPVKGGNPPTPRTVAKQRGRWNLHLKKPLGGAYVRDLTRRRLIEVLEGIASSAREEARQCLTLLRQLLDYCEDREQIDDNPAAGLKPAKVKARPGKPRERHLELPELRDLWMAIDDNRTAEGLAATAMLSLSVANAIKLLILTGTRRGEVAGMRWSEVKRDTWMIPGERTKNAKPHKVYLAPLALELLREQRQLSSGDYVFESTRDAGKPIHYDTITTAVARLQGRARKDHDETAPLYHHEHFTTHDLRRTCATLWTKTFMADPLLVDAMLSHSPPRLLGTYNRDRRWDMQVDIWKRWGATVNDMVANDPGANVVSLRGGVA